MTGHTPDETGRRPGRWQDTDVTLHRSAAHSGTWWANIPSAEIQQIGDGAGPLRIAQRWAVGEAERYDYIEPGAVTRWKRENADTFVLQERREAS